MERLLSRLHLRQIRLVDAVAKSGQLSLAAESLSITQPAASRTLAEIERLVGERLFDRRPKGMVATPIGEVFARHAGTLIGQLDATVTDLEAFHAGRAGVVRIGTIPGPAVGFVVPAVRALKARAPRSDVSIDVAPSIELMTGLLRGDYDLVLGRVPQDVDPRLLEIRRGRVEVISFITRKDHPIHDRGPVALKSLGALTWVIQRTGLPLREAIEQAFINRNLPVPQETIDTASLLFMMGYLNNTDAVAAVTTEIVDLLAASDVQGLCPVAMAESIILPPYHLIRRRHHAMTPICERMLDLLSAEIAI